MLLSSNLTRKRLQIDTDLLRLRIITSTADELSRCTNIDDLEPKIWVLVIFFAICGYHISTVNCVEITGDRPRQPANEIFTIKHIDFNSASFDPLGTRSPPYKRIKIWVPPSKRVFSAIVD